jgi:hypothetical protein
MDAYDCDLNDEELEAELALELAALGEITAEEIADAQRRMDEDEAKHTSAFLHSGGHVLEDDVQELAAHRDQRFGCAREAARLAIAALSDIAVANFEDTHFSLAAAAASREQEITAAPLPPASSALLSAFIFDDAEGAKENATGGQGISAAQSIGLGGARLDKHGKHLPDLTPDNSDDEGCSPAEASPTADAAASSPASADVRSASAAVAVTPLATSAAAATAAAAAGVTAAAPAAEHASSSAFAAHTDPLEHWNPPPDATAWHVVLGHNKEREEEWRALGASIKEGRTYAAAVVPGASVYLLY